MDVMQFVVLKMAGIVLVVLPLKLILASKYVVMVLITTNSSVMIQILLILMDVIQTAILNLAMIVQEVLDQLMMSAKNYAETAITLVNMIATLEFLVLKTVVLIYAQSMTVGTVTVAPTF